MFDADALTHLHVYDRGDLGLMPRMIPSSGWKAVKPARVFVFNTTSKRRTFKVSGAVDPQLNLSCYLTNRFVFTVPAFNFPPVAERFGLSDICIAVRPSAVCLPPSSSSSVNPNEAFGERSAQRADF